MKQYISIVCIGILLGTTACGSMRNNNTSITPVETGTTTDHTQPTEVTAVPFTPESAQIDIKTNQVRILLPGGIVAPAPMTKADEVFQTKYHIQYYSQGCVHQEGEDEAGYNRTVFKYLDRRYGKNWRQEVRKDAVGIRVE
jgi:hypothetical protein